MNQPSKTVFLSYAHADADAVTRVYQHLKAAGLDPWMDKFNLLPGQDWRAEIEKGIRHSGAFLSLLSGNSLDRGGILRGEMKMALDLRAERLDDRGLLIPVRLEHCDLPKDLHDIQTLDWYQPDGPEKLTKALSSLLPPKPSPVWRRWWALAAVAAVCIGAGLFAYRQATRETVTAAPAHLGLTLWRVTTDNATGSGTCGSLRFSRQPLTTPVRTGDRLRLDVRSSRAGYVYVISRELGETGDAGAPRLLFPVRMLNDGKNQITPGSALMIPPASDVCQTLTLTHAGAAEEITVVFSEKKLDYFPLRDEPYSIDPAIDVRLGGSANKQAITNARPDGEARDVQLPDSESRDLNYSVAASDAGFDFPDKSSGPMVARFTVKTLQ